MISRTALLAGLLLLGMTGSLGAADWPQWRGPNRDGKVTGFTPPDSWPTQPTQKRKAHVGIGDSTPALVGGKLYAFGRQDADEVVQCLDATTGKVVWESRYPANYVVTGRPSRHPGTRSSPVAAGGKICTLGVGGILSCFNASNGNVLWRKQSTNDYSGVPYKSDSSMSPVIVDGLCIVDVGAKTNGAVFAFDLTSGQQKWKWDGDGPSSSSPVIMNVQGTKQLVTLTAKYLVGLEVSDGKLLWQLPFEAAQGNNTTPIVDGQTVIYTGQGKGMFAIKVEKQGDALNTAPVWGNSSAGARFTTPVLKDGLLFGYNGHLFCANARTGETLWTDTAARGNSAALVDAGEVMLALCVNSELIVFKPDAKQYAELAKYKVADSETWAHPVVDGNKIYVRDRENVTLWTVD